MAHGWCIGIILRTLVWQLEERVLLLAVEEILLFENVTSIIMVASWSSIQIIITVQMEKTI